MIENTAINSFNELLQHVQTDIALGRQRNFLEDSATCLRVRGIEVPMPEVAGPLDLSIPTLVAANHYVRPIHHRRSPLTTLEAIITTSVITQGLQHVMPGSEIDWLAQGDLAPNWHSFRLADREAQRAAIACYDHLPVSSRAQDSAALRMELRKRLARKRHIGVYPEGGVRFSDTFTRYQMGPMRAEFASLLMGLRRDRVTYQILPTSVYQEDGKYRLRFGNVIQPGNPRTTAMEIQQEIVNGLPPHMRGRGAVNPFSERDRLRGWV